MIFTFNNAASGNQIFQWDSGLYLEVSGNLVSEDGHAYAHFQHSASNDILSLEVEDGRVAIPNILLQTAGVFRVFCYVNDAEYGKTLIEQRFAIIPRPLPPEYIYDPTPVITYPELVDLVEDLTALRDALSNVSASAETLPAGSAASAEATPSPDGLAFVFGIPRGDKGERGEQGEQGERGEQGIPGKDGKDAVVDPTLSIAGEAADAKATGDALNGKMDKVDPVGSGKFQFGENVSAVSSESIAQGSGTTAGGKAFTVTAIGGTAANRQLTLDSVTGLAVGMLCSVYLKDVNDAKTTNIDGFGEITAISGNVVTFNGGFSWNYTLDSEQSSHMWVVGYPELGTRIIGDGAMAFGRDNIAQNEQTLVTGRENIAAGKYAVVNGRQNKGIGYCTHVEGRGNTVNGMYASADGRNHTVGANYARAVGYNNEATGAAAFAEGSGTHATHEGAHTEGLQTHSGNAYQHVAGRYNVRRSGAARVTGWGEKIGDVVIPKNIEVLDTEGNLFLVGSIQAENVQANDFGTVFRSEPNSQGVYVFMMLDSLRNQVIFSCSDGESDFDVRIEGVDTPIHDNDAANKAYVDTKTHSILAWTNPNQSAGMGAATVNLNLQGMGGMATQGRFVIEFAMTQSSNEYITYTIPAEPFESGAKRFNVIADYSAFNASTNARGRQIVGVSIGDEDSGSISFGTGYQNGATNSNRIIPTRIWFVW